MNITVENLGPCKRLVRFEIDVPSAEETFKSVVKQYQKHAALPGFRPGKAPEEMVVKKYEQEIAEEAKRKLISDAYRKGIKEQNLNVIGYPDIEEIQVGRGQPFQFAATVEIVPDFPMPEYRGLPGKRENRIVSAEDVDRAINALRLQKATFQKVERPLQEGDMAVVNYSGTCEGKPITDLAPVARGLTEQKNFWIEVKPGSFLPGFSEQLIGAKAGEKRSVKTDFPADFVTTEVAGKQGLYEVELVEAKERILPELNDQFAQSFDAENVEKLREGVRQDLQHELNLTQKRDIRNQVVNALLNRVDFELPETPKQYETNKLVYEMVADYQKRGLSREVIDQQKDKIYALASQGAQGRVKAMLLFQKIAEKEGIRVSQEEVNNRIIALANAYQMTAQKFAKELEARNGLEEVFRELLNEKVISFLQEHARIEDVEPAPAPS